VQYGLVTHYSSGHVITAFQPHHSTFMWLRIVQIPQPHTSWSNRLGSQL